jgi:mono/diheme cytochrome c family protein
MGFQLKNAAHASAAIADRTPVSALHMERTSSSDLELGGDLAGISAGLTRFITRVELESLPQATYTVVGDANFSDRTVVSGVPLEELAQLFAAKPKSDMVIAICDDRYLAPYPHSYLSEHHPLLVLAVNGNPPAQWPKSPEGDNDMGPYLISNPAFKPSFKILSHVDEPQIPWGVVRLEFRNQKEVYGAIAPRGSHAEELLVQEGYKIAEQNCLRCHNLNGEGGLKGGHSWQVLSAWAKASPDYFAAYVQNPQSKSPNAKMPGNPGYDNTTLKALTAYFQTFSSQEKQ